MMQQFRKTTALRHAALVTLLTLVVGGCSTFDDWIGEADPPLPGERISVAQRTEVLEVPADQQNAGPIVVPAPVNNANWAQPGGTASNAPVHLSASSGLKKAWTASAGEGSSGSGRLTSPPIIMAGNVFTLDAAARVTAINAGSGRQVWRSALARDGEEAEEGYGGGVTADFGRVVAATGFGDVFALDPATGQKLWTRDLGLPIRAAPTAANGRVYVITVNNEVHCIDIESGEVLWDFRRYSDSAGVLANTSAAVDGSVVVVPYKSGELLAFETANGKPMWGDSLTRTGRLSGVGAINDIAGRPAISNGVVYAVSHSGRLAAIDLKSGDRRWALSIASTQTPWIAGDTLFVVTLNGQVSALDAKGGAVRWVRQFPEFEDPEERKGRILYSGPVLAGGQLLLVSSKGGFITLSPETGQTLSETSLGERFYIAPVVAQGTVFLLADDATLIAMR